MAVIENRSGMYGLAVEHRKRGKAAIALSQTGGGLKSEWGPKLTLRPLTRVPCRVRIAFGGGTLMGARAANHPWDHAGKISDWFTRRQFSPSGDSAAEGRYPF